MIVAPANRLDRLVAEIRLRLEAAQSVDGERVLTFAVKMRRGVPHKLISQCQDEIELSG